jgi:Holliday junction resolvase RusA-like endonuclease
MMKYQFFLPLANPPTVTYQEHRVGIRNGKPFFYDSLELRAARMMLKDHLAQHRPAAPMTGGVRLIVKWCFPIPNGRHHDGEYRISKPDTDNLQKLLKDCMTAVGFWKDDAQVCSELCEKFWAERTGIWIYAEELWE